MHLKSTKFVLLAICMLFICNAMKANGYVTFNFKKNPWKFINAKQGDEPNVGKFEDGFEIKEKGFTIVNKKRNDTNWNRIENGFFVVYPKNDIVITAPAGVEIYRINIVVRSIWDFGLKNDKHLLPDPDEEMAMSEETFGFDYVGKVATFTGNNKNTIIETITVNYTGTPTAINSINKPTIYPIAVYNLSGVKVGDTNSLNNLPKGVYIVNGKKVSN